jgi:hypothetical protein
MKIKIFVALIICLHILVLSQLIFFPYPENFLYPYLLHHGFVPYKDLIDQHFPGFLLLPFNLLTLGITGPLEVRLFLYMLIAINHLLIFLITQKMFKNISISLLANSLYTLWQPFLEGWEFWIDSVLASIYLGAFLLLWQMISKKKIHWSKYASLGFICALGVLCKQTAVLLPITCLALLWHYKIPRTQILFFTIGLIAPLLAVFSYLSLQNVLSDFWYWTVTFNSEIYSQFSKPIPAISQLTRVLIVYCPYLLITLISDKKIKLLLITFGAISVIGALNRFDFLYFQPSLPFAVIVSAYVLRWCWQQKRLWLIIGLYSFIAIYWNATFYKGHLGAKVFFFDEQNMQIARDINQIVRPNEEVFIFGPSPHLYYLSQTIPPGHYFVYLLPWYMLVSEDKQLEVLKSANPRIIIRDQSSEVEGFKLIEYAAKINRWIDEYYMVVDKKGTIEYLKRKDEYAYAKF